jgi:hypothetical protein
MKTIYVKTIHVIGAAILIAACSTHRVRCQGALQPINKPSAPAAGPPGAPAAGSPEAPAEPQP